MNIDLAVLVVKVMNGFHHPDRHRHHIVTMMNHQDIVKDENILQKNPSITMMSQEIIEKEAIGAMNHDHLLMIKVIPL